MIKLPSSWSAMVGLLAMALILVSFPSNDAGAHKTTRAKAVATQQQKPEKPVKLRYYGGPKSPMYPG
jgi:hypothetical protein